MSDRKMIISSTVGALLLGLPLLLAPLDATAGRSCSDLEQAVRGASRAANAESAADLFREAESSRACTARALSLMGRNTAHAFYRRAFTGSVMLEEKVRLLNRALMFGRPWQVLAVVADMEKAAKSYAKATALYQEALDDINDEALNPNAPPKTVIASIHKKAQTTRLLAPHYVKRVDRAGNPSGLARRRIRGFVARRTAVPIHFEYNKAEFTLEGKKAAKDMLGYLSQQKSPDIQLIGHTDPRGGDVYNKDLSKRRAAAVKSFMIANGYAGRIRTIGRGESETFIPDDPGSYTQEERWQLDRRVELER